MKKLIVIDEGLIKHKAIFAYIGQYEANLKAIIVNKKCSEEEAIDVLEKKIKNKELWMMYPPSTFLKMIIGYLKKLGVTLDDMVVVAEDFGSWRKSVDTNYKAQRKEYRESRMPAEWWKDMYKTFNELMITLSTCLPWQFIKSYKCESDDVASVAVRFLDADEKILITSDEDWQMLCSIPNVKLFSPYSKKFKIVKNPEAILLKKIQGDKCLEGHAPITMANGTMKMIKDLAIKDRVATYNFETKKIEINSVKKIGKSFSNVRRYIYLDNDKTPLKITPNHKLYTKRGWVHAKNIRPSDIIYKYNELKYMIKTNISHNFYKLGYLHGYLEGDGSISKWKGLTYTSTDIDGLNRIKDYLMKLFKYPVQIVVAKKENWKPNCKKVYEINISCALKDNFFKYYMLKQTPGNYLIRRQYFRGFVAGFFDAEGSSSPKILNLKNGEQRIVWSVVFSNTKKERINYIYKCLKLFGIKSKIYLKKRKNFNDCYIIELTETTKNVSFFINFRPAIKRKYPDLSILSNGRRVRTVKTVYAKNKSDFINYNIQTENKNYFAKGVLIHNSDNLLEPPKNEKEYETRKLIVDLLHLPHYVEEPIKELLFKTVPKNVYLSKIPFRACKQQIKQLYNL